MKALKILLLVCLLAIICIGSKWSLENEHYEYLLFMIFPIILIFCLIIENLANFISNQLEQLQ